MTELAAWDSFYVITGSAAGALIGLQFVVLTLIAQRPNVAAPEAGNAFSTPTIVHFGTALLLAALLRAPWHAILPPAILWGVTGLAGLVYVLVTIRRFGVRAPIGRRSRIGCSTVCCRRWLMPPSPFRPAPRRR